MRTIGVGIRIDPTEGLSFSGIEEVNSLLNCGGKVTAIEPGNAIMRKLGEGDGNVRLTLSGCDIKVVIDDSAVESSPQTLQHDQLYKEGCDLISPFMKIVNREAHPADSPTARETLQRGIELLNRAISILPSNWSAYWIIGKAHQALGNSEDACNAFGKAYGLHKENADVSREYMIECLKLGRADQGVAAARHAVFLKKDNAGLLANLGLALLIAGKLEEAAATISKAIELAPNDNIARNLKQAIFEVQSGRRSQPTTLADL